MKQVSFSLFPEQEAKFKALVEGSIQGKIIRNYLLNEYKLPKDLSLINQGNKKDLKVCKFYFDDATNEWLNELVSIVRDKGFIANRSSIMRDVIDNLISKLESNKDVLPKNRKLIHSTFYFERGTREILEKLISFRDRNAIIERFILEEYSLNNKTRLLDKPIEPEQIRLSIDSAAIIKLDEIAKELNIKGLSRAALMRNVVDELITIISKTDAKNLIVERQLHQSLQEYQRIHGFKKLKETLSTYLQKNETE